MNYRKKILGVIVSSTIVISTFLVNGTSTFASDFTTDNIKNTVVANANINNTGNRYAIIDGHDERIQVTNATEAPYSSVCYLDVAGKSRGSGVVIGKNTILTNRHVADGAIYDGSKITIHVGQTSRTKYLGSFKGDSIIYYPDKNTDLAIVHVKPNDKGESIGDVGSIAKCVENPPTPDGTPIRVIGYPADRVGQNMWESFGTTTGSQMTNRIRYSAATAGGSSGAPVFNDNNELIGIHFGSANKFNVAERFSTNVYKFIEDNVK